MRHTQQVQYAHMPGVVNINVSDIYPKKRTRGATESEKLRVMHVKLKRKSTVKKMQKECWWVGGAPCSY